jgi:hypothetical protein
LYSVHPQRANLGIEKTIIVTDTTTEVNENTEDDNIKTNYETMAKKKQKELGRSSLFQRSWLD